MIHFGVKGTLLSICLALLAPLQCRAEFTVVTTTSIIADTASRIGGNNILVTALMGEGIDPHLYKASPGDLRRLSQASLVLHNGLHLEGKIADVLERLAQRQPVVAVTERIPKNLLHQLSEGSATYDPHVWFDIMLWSYAAERIRDAFITLDPSHEAEFRTRCDELKANFAKVHDSIITAVATIPAERRLLVTSHDAFGYFGARYGLEVLAIQGASTDSEASLRDITLIVDKVTARKVPAVFIESSVSPKTIEALVQGARARGHALVIGGELYSDALGGAGTPEGTYIGMMEHNRDTIVRALTQGTPQ